jgi:4-hydroxymandelate oxidase
MPDPSPHVAADARQAIAYPPIPAAPVDLDAVVSLRDFEAPGRERLHPAARAYYDGGAWDGHTLRANLEAWDRYQLLPRVLVDVSETTLETRILGRPAALPVGVAPAALHGLAHPDAELATVRAAAAAGAVCVLSTVSSCSLEQIAAAAPDARRWFQLYVQSDWAVTRRLVERAADAGYEAIVLTVDAPVLGYRDDTLRVAFDPGEDAYGNLPKRDSWRGGSELDQLLDMRGVPLTWDRLDEIRSWAPLPLVLKGVLAASDARIAVDRGVDGVWVSNHGGRQLDRSPAGIDVLADVVDAVEGRADVYLDGGIRRGPDVLVALALGATAVFTARPFLYALACAGEPGVARAFEILQAEVDRALAIAGATSPAAMTRDHVMRARARA